MKTSNSSPGDFSRNPLAVRPGSAERRSNCVCLHTLKNKVHVLLRKLFTKKKVRLRRRPYTIEEKSKEERPVCSESEDRACRICFDDKKKENPIVSCRCKGTIGLVHLSCLEKWLAMSNTHTCELCGYVYQTIRTPKYPVLYSIYHWAFIDRNPQYHRGLKSDLIVFVVLTPFAFIGVYSCIVAADFYSKEPHKYSPASRWTTISLLIMVILLTFAYYLWVAVTVRFHTRVWYIWWQATNTVKVIPRSPNSSNLESAPPRGNPGGSSQTFHRRAQHDSPTPRPAVSVESQLMMGEYSV